MKNADFVAAEQVATLEGMQANTQKTIAEARLINAQAEQLEKQNKRVKG